MWTVWKGGVVCGVGIAVACMLFAGSGRSQSNSPAAAEKPLLAEQYFKNVQILKGIPVDEFMGTMGFIAASTGMNCTDCHVDEALGDWSKYADDSVPEKQTARRMMLMVRAINQSNFGGKREVTCYSCHRGTRRPEVIPNLKVQYSAPPPEDPDEVTTESAGGPAAEQILAKYYQAIGGEQKAAGLKSLIGRGNYTVYDDPEPHPVELYAKSPNQRMFVMHTPNGDSTATCDGVSAWTATPQTDTPFAVLTLSGGALEGAKVDAALTLPSQIKQILVKWKTGPLSNIDDEDMQILQGTTASGYNVKLYFDAKSGLLVRQVHYTDTPIGAIPIQVDYSDYREVAGVKIPFKWTTTWTDGRSNFELTQVQANAMIDAAKFSKPAPSVAPKAVAR